MCLETAIYFNSLPTETKIIIMQISLLFIELIYFLYLKRYFKEEKSRIYKNIKNNITIPEFIVKNPGVLRK